MIDTRSTGYPIFFDAAPPVGTQVTYWKGEVVTLRSVTTYQHPDPGRGASLLLEWERADGSLGTTGLRGKSIYKRSAADVHEGLGR